jgi:hypothetical protein
MAKDKVAVTGYAMSSQEEDVAETFRTYIQTRGTPKHYEYEAIVPNRFKILSDKLRHQGFAPVPRERA